MKKFGRKIGIFTGYATPHLGGVERYVDKLSIALSGLGYEIVIITSNHANLPSKEKEGDRTIYRLPIYNLAKQRYPIPRKSGSYRELLSQIEAENIDYFLLNTRFHLTSLVGAKMGKKAGRPVMLVEHGTDHFTVNIRLLDYFGKIYEHILTRIIRKYVDKFYGVSRNCNKWLQHFNINADGVFYNAIDTSDALRVKEYFADTYPDDAIVITYAGRLIKEKGILNLLDAFSDLQKRNARRLELVIAGDGDLLEHIKTTYKNPNIHIVGRLDFSHVMSLYKRTDIFVYPSLYPEGLPTSILEAGLMKCAIVATPRGGTEEVIPDENYGRIIDGKIESLQSALTELVYDDLERKRISDNVYRRVAEAFNWDSVARAVDMEIKSFNWD